MTGDLWSASSLLPWSGRLGLLVSLGGIYPDPSAGMSQVKKKLCVQGVGPPDLSTFHLRTAHSDPANI